MNTTALTRGLELASPAGTAPDRQGGLQALRTVAGFWFLVALAGQLLFVFYVVVFFGGTVWRGDVAAFNKAMLVGRYIAGDTLGNLAIGAHLALAVIVTVGGPLQLIPQIRAHAPAFHRWNGRIYLITAVVASLAGVYLIWNRPGLSSVTQQIGISLNAALNVLFAAIAVRHAIARDIATHRRWALRLFIAVSGVWFFRIGFMFWVLVNNGPVGFDPKTFRGPFIDFMSFASYLLPLAMLELYLRARDRGSPSARLAMAGALGLLTIAMGVGIFGAAMGLWLRSL